MKMKPVQSPCRGCSGPRQHDVIESHSVSDDDGIYSVTYQIVKCRGCETVSFRKESHDYSVGWYNENDEYEYDISVVSYPKFLTDHHGISSAQYLPKIVRAVYRQTISA